MWWDLSPRHPAHPKVAEAVATANPVKKCAKCGAHHPTYKYNGNKAQPDGLQTMCRPCEIAARRVKLARQKAREAGHA